MIGFRFWSALRLRSPDRIQASTTEKGFEKQIYGYFQCRQF